MVIKKAEIDKLKLMQQCTPAFKQIRLKVNVPEEYNFSRGSFVVALRSATAKVRVFMLNQGSMTVHSIILGKTGHV